jgi:hypothetical protein
MAWPIGMGAGCANNLPIPLMFGSEYIWAAQAMMAAHADAAAKSQREFAELKKQHAKLTPIRLTRGADGVYSVDDTEAPRLGMA